MPQAWDIEEASELYGIERWGESYYRVNPQGHVLVDPTRGKGPGASLLSILSMLEERNFHTPVTLRFPQILRDRISRLHESFISSKDEYGYQGDLRLVYPMKVNQRKETVGELIEAGAPWNYGLEVGSKPELLSALAMETPKDALLVINGFKDEEYVRLAAGGMELGKNVVIVMDKMDEAHLLAKTLKDAERIPMIGIRLKLYAKGGGKWAESTGETAKFGLMVPEVLHAVKVLKEAGLADRIKMVHFHIGSQVTNIKRIHASVLEGARMYAKLRHLGVPIEYVNVGGGLAVDYDGSNTASSASMNYDMREYTNTIVYTLKTVADEEQVPHPTIVSESGRAVVAYHSVLALDIIKRVPDELPLEDNLPNPKDHRVLHDMRSTLDNITIKNYPEAYHDAVALREEVSQRFNFGLLTLEERSKAEVLFRYIAHKVLRFAERDDNMSEEFIALKKVLQHKFIANFSLFQSTPDVWGVKQLFPIMPLERLNEQPKEFGTIVDITCDSDGEIRNFIDLVDIKDTIELHTLDPEKPYRIGIFLTGAYQDTLGDFHNLFGRVHEAYIHIGEDGTPTIEKVVEGDDVEEVLWLVNWEMGELDKHMKESLARKVGKGELEEERAAEIHEEFRVALDGYTYLEK